MRPCRAQDGIVTLGMAFREWVQWCPPGRKRKLRFVRFPPPPLRGARSVRNSSLECGWTLRIVLSNVTIPSCALWSGLWQRVFLVQSFAQRMHSVLVAADRGERRASGPVPCVDGACPIRIRVREPLRGHGGFRRRVRGREEACRAGGPCGGGGGRSRGGSWRRGSRGRGCGGCRGSCRRRS